MVEPVDEQLRRRVVSDRDEETVGREVERLVRLDVAQTDAGELAGVDAQHLLDHERRQELDLLVGAGALEHDLRGPELVAAVHDRDLGRELRQEERLLHRRVAAADDDDLALAVEGAVAGRAVRDAPSVEGALRLEPELAGRCPGRDDHRLGQVLVVADVHLERPLGEIDAGDVVGEKVRPEPARLGAELGHHLRAHDAVLVAGVVLDLARDHQLAAPVEALDQERAHVGARCVERSRVPGRTAADDDHVTNVAHVLSSFLVVLGACVRPHDRERIGACGCSLPHRGQGLESSRPGRKDRDDDNDCQSRRPA